MEVGLSNHNSDYSSPPPPPPRLRDTSSTSSSSSTPVTSPPTPNKHVNFNHNPSGEKKREKFLTAKYGAHQMALIRKRLRVRRINGTATKIYNYHIYFHIGWDVDVRSASIIVLFLGGKNIASFLYLRLVARLRPHEASLGNMCQLCNVQCCPKLNKIILLTRTYLASKHISQN